MQVEQSNPNPRQATPHFLWLTLTAPFLVAALLFLCFRAISNHEVNPTLFLSVYIPLEVLRICICLDILLVRLIPRTFDLDLQSLLIAGPFLMAAILFTFRLVGNLVLPANVGAEASNQVFYLRILARWSIVLFLTAASFVPPHRKASASVTNAFVALLVLLSVTAGITVLKFGDHLPQLFSIAGNVVGVTGLGRALGYAAMGLSFFAAYRFARIGIRKNDSVLLVIAAGLATVIPTEYAFTLVDSQNDMFKLFGNVLGASGFVFAVVALVKKSVVRPYEELSRAQEELASTNQELEAFVYSVSHDLHTPLHVIKGFCAILLEESGERLDSRGKEYLTRIFDSTKKMDRLVDDLLYLSRVSREEIKLSLVNLSESAESAVRDLREAFPGRTVEAVIGRNITALADSRLIGVVLTNLLGNAWKFTAKADDARIEFGVRHVGAGAIYYVKDNGAGFDPADGVKLFQPFKRLHSTREFEGTGIGLTIVERIIRKHRGWVCAEGAKGKGATFFFTLEGRSKEHARVSGLLPGK